MTLNPSKFADFILDKDGKIVRHHAENAENAERNSKHLCSVFKKMEILLIFMVAWQCFVFQHKQKTVKQTLNVNI